MTKDKLLFGLEKINIVIICAVLISLALFFASIPYPVNRIISIFMLLPVCLTGILVNILGFCISNSLRRN